MTFSLHPNLEGKIFIAELPLCRLLLENERNYLWLLLVPRKPNLARIIDLTTVDQLQLLKELDIAQRILWNEFKPHQLNVAAIGNKTPQLHLHLIARHTNDPAWPNTVWDHPVRAPYEENEKKTLIAQMQSYFSAYLCKSDNTV